MLFYKLETQTYVTNLHTSSIKCYLVDEKMDESGKEMKFWLDVELGNGVAVNSTWLRIVLQPIWIEWFGGKRKKKKVFGFNLAFWLIKDEEIGKK